MTDIVIICLTGRWFHNCRIEINRRRKTKISWWKTAFHSDEASRREGWDGMGWGGEGRGGMGWADVSQPSVSCWCVSPQQLRATLTMALAASWTLLALFVTFCTPGWTGKWKRKARLCLPCMFVPWSRCTVCTDVPLLCFWSQRNFYFIVFYRVDVSRSFKLQPQNQNDIICCRKLS